MASSSDPEKDSTQSQSKAENPFIRFRKFADQQISSLLQGIIGLPSAFSGKPSENPRWAVFDEDLRRRDELQARQQELRESEARRLSRKTTDEEVAIPVKKSLDWEAFSRWQGNDPATNQDNNGMRDLPLYSPVTHSLFAHLHQHTDGDVDWKQIEHISDPWAPLIQLSKLRRDQQSSDCLKMTQYMVYNQLNGSPKLRSDYSLLPYLMFSPYSPLRLAESRSISPQSRTKDTFPYYSAFEDLIRTTQPPQIQTPFSQLFGNPPALNRFLDGSMNFDPTTRASINYGWIQHLHHSGVLQESEARPFPRFISIPFPVSLDAPPESVTSDKKLVSKEAQTEQEMYEHFLRWASRPTVTDTMESVLAETKAAFAKQFESGDFPDIPRAFNGLMETKVLQELLEQLDPEKQDQAQRKSSTDTSSENPDKVISEHTVTERVKQVDGSVQTYVSVWKKFADGRETTTTTSHTEEQERDEDGNLKPLVLPVAEEPKALTERRKAEKEAEAKKNEKKGWFWN